MMHTPICLRLEAQNGRAIEEFRILDQTIETRQSTVWPASEWDEYAEWREVSSEELSDHVRDNTVVAQWLKRRLGWRRLLLACTPQQTLHFYGLVDSPDRHRAA